MENNSFWKNKQLKDFSSEEWEAICMRCGKCCLHKFNDNENIMFINIICQHFDLSKGCCSCYSERLHKCSCKKVDLDLLHSSPELLPDDCAYRLLYEGHDLPSYHPLVCGNREEIHKQKKTVMEMDVISAKPIIPVLEQVIEDSEKIGEYEAEDLLFCVPHDVLIVAKMSKT